MQLSRDLIVDAAMDILDDYGLADMTMRRLATQLGVAPGALYWHVENKQSLIAAIAERILAPALDDPQNDRASARDKCLALYQALTSRRDAAELCSSALAQPGSRLREDVEKRLVQALSPHSSGALTAAHALMHLTVGAAVHQQNYDAFLEVANQGVETPGLSNGGPQEVESQIELLLRGLENSR